MAGLTAVLAALAIGYFCGSLPWGLWLGRWFRGVDAAFPLSDHADFPSLIRYARATGASRVFTVHGHAGPLAAALRREGIRAEPLKEQAQLELL